jgi:hypothetical protein
MSAVRRLRILEQQAGELLTKLGYKPVIVSSFARSSRYIAFHMTADKRLGDGTVDSMMVKLRISLHPIESLAEAAAFCREEIVSVKKFFAQVPPDKKQTRFEVWVSIPLNGFQHFEITREGICEIRSPGDRPSRARGGS